jgi:hypothetical protein
MLHMLQWLYTYVANFCFQCFICFSDVYCKCVYLDVAYISHICCKCFYLDVAYVLQWFGGVFASVLDACFKCFICLEIYVVSVASRCFKSRSDVASRSLFAFGCLALMSPPSLDVSWASDPDAQAGATPSPSR